MLSYWSCESHSDDVYSIQHYVIKFVSGLRALRVPPPTDQSGTYCWNWIHPKSYSPIGIILNCLVYDWTVKNEWKVKWHVPKHDVRYSCIAKENFLIVIIYFN
jgi:hypothetical protein